jgi:hypothetical protein
MENRIIEQFTEKKEKVLPTQLVIGLWGEENEVKISFNCPLRMELKVNC